MRRPDLRGHEFQARILNFSIDEPSRLYLAAIGQVWQVRLCRVKAPIFCLTPHEWPK